MATIPKTLQPHINTAFPEHVCLVGTVLPNGYAQITPRGSTMVFDDDHIALWERGKGSTTASLHDGTKVTVYFRKPQLRADGMLPKGGIARFYGTAKVVKSGAGVRGSVAQAGAAGEGSRPRQEGLCRFDQGRAGGRPGRDGIEAGLRRSGSPSSKGTEACIATTCLPPPRAKGLAWRPVVKAGRVDQVRNPVATT